MPAFPSTIDLTTLTAATGFRIIGADTFDLSGYAVAAAGDVNGDGYADFFIGSQGASFVDSTNFFRSNAGAGYVIFGKPGGVADIDLANLGSAGFRIDGGFTGDHAGWSAANAGDVNNDGYDDLIVGAPNVYQNGLINGGAAYVVFGKASGFAEVDLKTLGSPGGSAGFRIEGAAAADWAGWSVSGAGDVNGDGFADVVVGAIYADNNGRDTSGSSYVIFGKSGGFGTINLATLGTAGFRIDGARTGDRSGGSVSAAGDVNGDGYGDLIIGAQTADGATTPDNGSSYVVFGKASGFANIDLASLGTGGFRIDGEFEADFSGTSVAAAGDVNGDGYADILVGAPIGGSSSNPNIAPGDAYVIFGKAGGFGTINLANVGADGFRIMGSANLDEVGLSVAAAGDVNRDGYDDVIIGANSVMASAYLIYGKAGGFGLVDLGNLGTAGVKITGATVNDSVVYSGSVRGSGGYVAGTDVNGDGLSDLIIGAPETDLPGKTNIGTSYVLLSQSADFASQQNGTAVGEILSGNSGSDRLDGLAGDDRLQSGAGPDSLIGGTGNDTLDGGTGADMLLGGTGNDTYVVDSRLDIIREAAGEGYDTVYVLAAGYTLSAEIELGRLSGAVATRLTGNAQDNTLVGNDLGLASTLFGAAGDDVLFGTAAADRLDGADGSDTFYTGGGADTVLGGAGDDQAVLTSLGAVFTELAGEGNDTVWVGVAGSYLVGLNIETGRLFGAGTALSGSATSESLVANATASMLDGNGGDDTLWGQAGTDTLNGGLGDDIMRTGGGADVCTGGAGNDAYVFLSTGAVAIELGNEGYDVVYQGAAGSFLIGNNVEEGRLFDAGNALTGNGSRNVLVGNATVASNLNGAGGNDVLYGGVGNDTLTGGAGNDELRGLGGADQFVFSGNWGNDQIVDFSRAEGDKLAIAGATFSQLAIVSAANTQVTFGANVIYLFGVTSLVASDFIFS